MENKRKLTSAVLRQNGIKAGYIFRNVRAYRVGHNSFFCCDYVIGVQTYYKGVPEYFSKNMKDGEVYSVIFLGISHKDKIMLRYVPNDTEWNIAPCLDAYRIDAMGITLGQVFEKCNVCSQIVKDIDGRIICISYVEICYKGAKLRCDIPSQFPFSIKKLENVEMCFMGYDKLGAPLFDFCVKHIEGKVKRVSPTTVEILQSDGSVILRSYTSACKHFRGLLDANVEVDLPLNLRPHRVCLDKQLMRKRCKEFYSEVGECFSCQVIGVTDKVYYVLCQDTFGFIDKSLGDIPNLPVGCNCLCKLLDCKGKICMLPFGFIKLL